MADTAHKKESQKKEHFDSEDILDQKCKKLAEMIISSKQSYFFTGAGISTACGIPDFRSGMNTILPTGPGCWEQKANDKINKNRAKSSNTKAKEDQKKKVRTTMAKAVPSKTHMAIKELIDRDIIQYCISQNVDGLHRRSGVRIDRLAELHGNTNLESCKKCKKSYMRDFRTRNAKNVFNHETGRICENLKCKGKLVDSIVNFGENLPEKEINNGFNWGDKSDLCIALGSSLTVTPAADIPLNTSKGGDLVIVNLQSTPLDSRATFRINGLIDDVMIRVMKYLKVEIPRFRLNRYFMVSLQKGKDLYFRSVDSNGDAYSLFKSVCLSIEGGVGKGNMKRFKQEPYEIKNDKEVKSEKLVLKLEFQGHYNEPIFEGVIDMGKYDMKKEQMFRIGYQFDGKWSSIMRKDGDSYIDL